MYFLKILSFFCMNPGEFVSNLEICEIEIEITYITEALEF